MWRIVICRRQHSIIVIGGRKMATYSDWEKKTWLDRISEYITRRTLTKEDGTSEIVTVERNEGEISQEGDAFSAETMNDLEERVDAGFTQLNTHLTECNTNISAEVTRAKSAESTLATNLNTLSNQIAKKVIGTVASKTTSTITFAFDKPEVTIIAMNSTTVQDIRTIPTALFSSYNSVTISLQTANISGSISGTGIVHASSSKLRGIENGGAKGPNYGNDIWYNVVQTGGSVNSIIRGAVASGTNSGSWDILNHYINGSELSLTLNQQKNTSITFNKSNKQITVNNSNTSLTIVVIA